MHSNIPPQYKTDFHTFFSCIAPLHLLNLQRFLTFSKLLTLSKLVLKNLFAHLFNWLLL